MPFLERLRGCFATRYAVHQVDQPVVVDLAPFVTHTMGLDDINKAFDLMHEGKSIRTVINF